MKLPYHQLHSGWPALDGLGAIARNLYSVVGLTIHGLASDEAATRRFVARLAQLPDTLGCLAFWQIHYGQKFCPSDAHLGLALEAADWALIGCLAAFTDFYREEELEQAVNEVAAYRGWKHLADLECRRAAADSGPAAPRGDRRLCTMSGEMLRFDEASCVLYNRAMSSALVRRVQRAYPQVYLACHVAHTTQARDHGLSERDARVLAHLDELAPVTVSDLARHLGVGMSTVTEAVQRLEALGLVARAQRQRDRRVVELRLTAAGVQRMQESSVLDPDRVAAVLDRLLPRERAAAVRGLELLARAAREITTSRSASRAPSAAAAGRSAKPSRRAP